MSEQYGNYGPSEEYDPNGDDSYVNAKPGRPQDHYDSGSRGYADNRAGGYDQSRQGDQQPQHGRFEHGGDYRSQQRGGDQGHDQANQRGGHQGQGYQDRGYDAHGENQQQRADDQRPGQHGGYQQGGSYGGGAQRDQQRGYEGNQSRGQGSDGGNQSHAQGGYGDQGRASYDVQSGYNANNGYGNQGQGGYGGANQGGYGNQQGTYGGGYGAGGYNANGGGGYGAGYQGQDRGGKPKSTDTIYITGLPKSVTERSLADFFGKIGLIKEDKNGKNKIWIYYDKQTGQPKGDATVSYEDEETATTSLEWFNGQQFMGSTLQVERADVYDWEAKRGARGGGRGGRGRGGRY